MLYTVFGVQLEGSLDEMRPDGEEIQQVKLVAPEDFGSLGNIGPVSRWFAGHCRPEQAGPFRVSDVEQAILISRYSLSAVWGARLSSAGSEMSCPPYACTQRGYRST